MWLVRPDVLSPALVKGNTGDMILRVLPVMIALNRATPELDVGIPVAGSDVGLILALIAFTLTMFWRITTPLSVLPPAGWGDGFDNAGQT